MALTFRLFRFSASLSLRLLHCLLHFVFFFFVFPLSILFRFFFFFVSFFLAVLPSFFHSYPTTSLRCLVCFSFPLSPFFTFSLSHLSILSSIFCFSFFSLSAVCRSHVAFSIIPLSIHFPLFSACQFSHHITFPPPFSSVNPTIFVLSVCQLVKIALHFFIHVDL